MLLIRLEDTHRKENLVRILFLNNNGALGSRGRDIRLLI